jgi:D-threo-aldose 1-dehydrogenase
MRPPHSATGNHAEARIGTTSTAFGCVCEPVIIASQSQAQNAEQSQRTGTDEINLSDSARLSGNRFDSRRSRVVLRISSNRAGLQQMQQIILPGTDLRVPRFLFGTDRLFNAGTRAQRLRLLEAAIAHGLTHFDTAPYYGYGIAERDLARVLRRHPHVTVTTKVGIYSPGGEAQAAGAVFLRKAGRRLIPSLSRPTTDWNLVRARRSLESSLRRLGHDRIDLYMLHEPQFALVAADEWLRWLEDEVRAGRVRHFGIAVKAAHLEPFLAAASPLAAIVQTADSLSDHEADTMLAHGRPLQITYGYVSSAIRRDRSVAVGAVLSQALARNSKGAVIVCTRRPERMALYASILAEARP